MSSPITTHILDTGAGKPASGVEIILDFFNDGTWTQLSARSTNEDGRVADLLGVTDFHSGLYRLRFATGNYYQKRGEQTFYPEVSIVFEVIDTSQHYHVPLLLNRFGYSTYRGS